MSLKSVTTEKHIETARYAKAMGHPVRMYVLELLSSQRCCYSSDLSDELLFVKSTISKDLKELVDAGQTPVNPPAPPEADSVEAKAVV